MENVFVQEELRIVKHVILKDCVQLVFLVIILLMAYAPVVLKIIAKNVMVLIPLVIALVAKQISI